MMRQPTTLLFLIVGLTGALTPWQQLTAEIQVGAAIVDVTPKQLPVLVNGGMLSKTVDQVNTPVSARAIVVDDGEERIAMVVVDSCMMPRDLLDEAKQLASERTEIRPDRMMISATHTHSAPSSMGALGTAADPTYVPYLREKLAEAIAAAEANLAPARVGYGVTNAASYTALRRWIRRPDRIDKDPFGNPTVRANMHSAVKPENATGPSGPEDPDLAIISFETPEGKPIAVLANFSMHYFGDKAISADYFGLFCNRFQDAVGKDKAAGNDKAALKKEADEDDKPFVAILSHGCSGDIWKRDYEVPADKRTEPTLNEFTDGLLKLALECYGNIHCEAAKDIAMAESRIPMKYRVPDAQRLGWAKSVLKEMGDRLPETQPEVYAREQILLDQMQSTEIVVQAIRIGDIGIATTPNETYALTGLKIKLQSPLKKQIVIELANGGDGYIPPPEQHVLGGYNTWAARSAGLEVTGEPKIVQSALAMLEGIAVKPRREFSQPAGKLTKHLLAMEPVAFWRLDEMQPPIAIDSSGNEHHGMYEDGVVFFLNGPATKDVCGDEPIAGAVNRAAHFAGGRMRTKLDAVDDTYSVSMWYWNGMPTDARETTGWMFSRDHADIVTSQGDHLGIGGTATDPGCLVFQHGTDEPVIGKTKIDRWTWNHVLLIREKDRVRVYLNAHESKERSNPTPEIELSLKSTSFNQSSKFFVGGRSDNDSNWEGKLDEVTLFDKAIDPIVLMRSFE